MSNAQRAMQFWSALVVEARNQQILSYDTLSRVTGVPRYGMSHPLGRILGYCQQAKIPLLPSIVVEQSTGRPADAHFKAPFNLEAEHRRVFIFDWLKNGCPSLSEFEEVEVKEAAAV